MEEDDFGELYGDQGLRLSTIGAESSREPYSGFEFFDDEIDEDKGHVGAPVDQTRPQSLPPTTKLQPAKLPDKPATCDQPAERDSDEDDDMLLLGYNCKSGSAASKLQANDTQSMTINDPEEEFAKFAERSKADDATDNGLISYSAISSGTAAAVHVPGITPTQELALTDACNLPLGSSDVSNHMITIPGLSTTVNAPFFDMGDNGDATQDIWEQRQVGKAHLRAQGDVAVEGADDWDTDSEDDLHIVLNTGYPFYAEGEKGTAARYEGGSEDEDDEDLIIFAGGEPNEEVEDKLLQPVLDGQGIPEDGLGDKQIGVEDGKGQQDKMLSGVPAPPQAPRGYGYHNYNSSYKYVRAGTTAVYSASAGQIPGGRGGPLKLINGRGDWRGSGRGFFGPHSTTQFPSWSTPSYEYTLPPSMTVFDIDLEALEDKPWRQPAVDVSDFFNFGFDEATWKDYCKQLAQLRLESTMQSKIRVYESGRTEQDYDPDLPPELAMAAGLREAGDKVQQRLGESETTVAGMGRRGYAPMIPLGRPIEVEGGLGDRRPSADSRKQRIRDSDSILLVDAVEIEDLETQGLHDENIEGIDEEADKDEIDDEQRQEDDQEEEEQIMEDPRAALKARQDQQDQHLWHKERVYGTKIQSLKGPSTGLNMESTQKLSGIDPLAVSTDCNVQSHLQTSSASEPSRQSGESPVTHRDLFSRSKPTTKPLAEERRDLDFIYSQRSQSSNICQDAESNLKSGIGEGESDAKRPTDREQQPHSRKENHAGNEEHQDCQSPVQRGDEFNTTAFRDAQIRDTSPEEVQVESSGCSSKRQRLVSPEGSHTASWDNYDGEKSARSGSFMKESRDSADSAMEGREDFLHYRKKYKHYPNMSRGDRYRDFRHESESHRKKKSSTFDRRDVEVEGHLPCDSFQGTKKRPKQGITEVSSKDSSRLWKDRDDAHGKGREEETEKKVYPSKEALHHKDKAGNRSDSRKKEEKDRDRGGSQLESRRKEVEKRDKQDSRRRDAEDRRDRFDKDNAHRETKDSQHTEKEVERSKYSERRKKEDYYRRKDRSEEASDYGKRERERDNIERHDKESSQYTLRNGDEFLKREKLEEHYRAKARDGSARDIEDSRQYQDSHRRVHKDEERAVQLGKSNRRHEDSRSWQGRNDSRLSDSTRSAEPRIHSKDRKKDLENHGKDKSWLHDGRTRSTSGRETLQVSESHDRDSGRHGRLSDDTRTSERGSHSDKHKFEAKRTRDTNKELNDLVSQSGDHLNGSRRKKAASEKMELGTRKISEDSVTVRTRGSEAIVDRSDPEETKESNVMTGKPSAKVRHFDTGERGSSEEDEQQKGRSKLERWMSHKDAEMNASLSQNVLKKDEKSTQNSLSRDKQCHDSFGVRENMDQDNRQDAVVEKKSSKISVPEEQFNGKVSNLNEKGAFVLSSKESDANVAEKGLVDDEPHEEKSTLLHTNMAAKLEKRKERFKVHVEDRDSLRKQDYEDNQLMDKDDSRQERPPRKRRWGSG